MLARHSRDVVDDIYVIVYGLVAVVWISVSRAAGLISITIISTA